MWGGGGSSEGCLERGEIQVPVYSSKTRLPMVSEGVSVYQSSHGQQIPEGLAVPLFHNQTSQRESGEASSILKRN